MRHGGEFSQKTRLAVWDRCGGHCERCGRKIVGKLKPEYDHIVPKNRGGDNTLENCACLCNECHDLKTFKPIDGDVPQYAKSERIRKRAAGVARAPSRPIPGSRRSRLKKKVNGQVEWR